MSLDYDKPFHANLYYHVLSQVDLGRDAANLYRRPGVWRRLFGDAPKWAAPLKGAIQASRAALTAQILPLVTNDLRELRGWLREYRRPFDDLPGHELADQLRAALRAAEVEYHRQFEQAGDSEIERFRATAESTLLSLLERLYDGRMPQVTVYASDPLTDGEFTFGRCYRTPAAQVVAVSLQGDPVQAALQLLHELTHAVTDRDVVPKFERDEHSTSVDSSGYVMHVELERAVVERDAQLIDEIAPEWSGAFQRWRHKWNA